MTTERSLRARAADVAYRLRRLADPELRGDNSMTSMVRAYMREAADLLDELSGTGDVVKVEIRDANFWCHIHGDTGSTPCPCLVARCKPKSG